MKIKKKFSLTSIYKKLLPHRIKTVQFSRGKRGENLAVRHIKKHTDFSILARNWSNGVQEIDIICKDHNVLVFVEVRARAENALVKGYSSITQKKKRNLKRGAYSYLNSLHNRPKTYRFDVIELDMKGHCATDIRHHKNIQIF